MKRIQGNRHSPSSSLSSFVTADQPTASTTTITTFYSALLPSLYEKKPKTFYRHHNDASPAESTVMTTTSSSVDPNQNLNQVINSIQKTLGTIHQLYFTVSSFNGSSQLPLLQRLSFVRFLDEKKSASSTARYGSQVLLTLKSRSRCPRPRYRDEYRGYRRRSRSRSPDYHRRHRRGRYDDDYDDERSPRHSSITYQIVKCIKNFVHQMEATVLMALLQPAPETFDLFDDLLRLQKCLRAYGFDVIRQIMADVSYLCQHMKSFPDRGAHDLLSENEIQIFRTPDGMLSTEQGIYITESVASNNLKQAKGRIKTYENNDNMVMTITSYNSLSNDNDIKHVQENGNSNSGRRDTGGKERSIVGKKDAGKPTKNPGKLIRSESNTAGRRS
ncbi:unnamed protein product [Lactuca virosa]|uniref:Uncharacterized protein n=1 Tax=Lactuca virosa TaxID=75947 RepID=A0AAU9M9P7_9ASTR|nr:unnamed protein product [Lactuca virosa]